MADTVIEFIQAKNGLPTAKVHNPDGYSFLLHSAYDPAAEARRLVEGYPSLKEAAGVVCLGLGLGYHVREVLRLAKPNVQVLVIESNSQLRERFQESAKDIPWDRVTVTDREDAVKTYVYSKHENLRGGFVIVEHPASLRLNPEFYDTMRNRVRDYVSLLLIDIGTAKTLNYFVQENNFANLKAIVSDPGIKTLENAFKGKPAVIVAAGPSLNKNIDLLSQAKNRSVIICVGTALKAMHAKGLHPDLVVTLDPTELNYKLFEGLTPLEEYLCYEPQTHYKIPPLFEGRRFAFNSFSSFFASWLKSLYGDKGHVEPGGSVAIAAFGIACLIGANPIVFIGQDLAFTNGYTHAKGTVYEGRKADLTTPSLHLFEVPAIGGGKVFTMRNMHTFIVRFEELFAQNKDRLIIDATEGGALKKGTEVMTFREAIDRYFKAEFPVLPVIEELHNRNQPDPEVRVRIRKEFTKTAREYKRLIRKLEETLSAASKVEELSKLTEKAGSGMLQARGTFTRDTLRLLKKRANQLNQKIKLVNAETRLVNLLDVLTFESEFVPLLPENASLNEQVKQIKAVYGLYLKAAKLMRKQLEDAVRVSFSENGPCDGEACEGCR